MNILLMFGIFIVLLLIGVPISFSIGVSSLVMMFIEDIPMTMLITKMFGGLDSFTILAIPFYILTGAIMNSGNLTERLVGFADSLVGHIKGGLAHVNVLASMFFAGISGSSTADSASIGAMLVPAMEKEGYDKKFTAAITAASSSIGPIIPPSIMFILYSSLTGVSVAGMFFGGMLPGIILGVFQMIYAYVMYDKVFTHKRDAQGNIEKKRFSIGNVWRNFKKAILVLVVPLIIMVGITTGKFTATEAGVVAAAYSMIMSLFVFKTLRVGEIGKVLLDAAKSCGMVLFLLATATTFGNMLTMMNFPKLVLGALTSLTDNGRILFLIMILFYFVMGFFMDGTPILVMFAPAFHNIAVSLGFDPIWFGVTMVIAVLVGGITPPVGVLLFVNAKIAKISFDEIVSAIWPFVAIMMLLVLLCWLVPPLVTFLPSVLL